MKYVVIALMGIGSLCAVRAYYAPAATGGAGGQAALTHLPLKDATALVERGDLKIAILCRGRLTAKDSTKIASTVHGEQLTIVSIVPEGTLIEKGAELVRFDDAKQKQELLKSEAEVKTAGSDVEVAQGELEIQDRENTKTLKEAQFALKQAQLDLEKSECGELPRQDLELDMKSEEAQSAFIQAKETYEKYINPRLQSFFSLDQIEEKRIAKRSAEIKLELAKRDKIVFTTYTRPVTINEKHSKVESTATDASKIESVNASKLMQKKVQLDQKQEKLRQAREHLDDVKQNLDGFVLRSPAAGLVLYGEHGDTDQGGGYEEYMNRNIHVGGQIQPGQTVITLPKMDEMAVKASIPEADINKVKVGMHAFVTSDAYPNLKEGAAIVSIGNVAKRSWEDVTNSYEVVLSPRKGDLGVRPGVTANIEIQIDELKNVLKIPVSAVFAIEGRNIVYVKQEKIAARDVQLGNSNDSFVACDSGLKEGESVLLYQPEHIDLPPKPPGSQPAAPATNGAKPIETAARTPVAEDEPAHAGH